MRYAAIVGWVVTVLVGASAAPAQVSPGPGLVDVTVEGKGVTKDEAIRDGLRKAVERGAGTIITSESETRDFALIRDTVLARAQGFVQKYRILSAVEDDDEEIWRIKMVATVSTKGVKDVWGTVKVLLKQIGRPKIMVAVTENIRDAPPAQPLRQENSTVQTRVENLLLKSGFLLVNRKQLKAIEQKQLQAAIAANQPGKIQMIAKKFGAQIFLTGSTNSVWTSTDNVYGVILHTYGADGDLKVYRSDTARMMSSQNGVARSSDENPRNAAKKSIWALGDQIAPKIQQDILRFWLDAVGGHTELQLEIANVTFKQYLQIKKAVAGIEGVEDVTAKYHDKIADCSLQTKLTGEQLAEKLVEAVEQVEITDLTGNTVKGTWKEK